MAQVCDQFSPFLFRVKNLGINTTRSSSEQDDVDGEQWLELVRSFGGARDFRVAGELTTDILCALGPADGGHTTVLPACGLSNADDKGRARACCMAVRRSFDNHVTAPTMSTSSTRASPRTTRNLRNLINVSTIVLFSSPFTCRAESRMPCSSRPENNTRPYTIGTTFPNHTLDDDSLTTERPSTSCLLCPLYRLSRTLVT